LEENKISDRRKKKDMNKKISILALVVFFVGAIVSGSLLYMTEKNTISVVDNTVTTPDQNMNDITPHEPSWHTMGEYSVINGQLYEKTYTNSKDYTWTPLGAEATPTAGFLSFYYVNHSATGSTTYLKNTSTVYENWSKNIGAASNYAYSKNTGFNPELQANTAFDMIVRCKFTRNQGPWNGTKWIGTNVRVNITISGDITMSNILGGWAETYNSSTASSYYGNAYWCGTTGGTGSGLQIHPGATITVSSIVISAKF
jgi:hypothetical protein